MKIAIDIRSLLDGRPSGIAEYTANIINELVAVAPEHHYELFYNAARAVALPGIPETVSVRQLPYPNKVFNAGQWLARRPRWDQFVTADCFFVPSLRLVPLAPATPLVTTVHDLSFEHFPEFFSLRRRAWHAMMRPRELLERSTHLIAVSEATARDVEERYAIPTDHISVIHSGVTKAAEVSGADEAAVRERYHLPPRFMLYLGTLEPRKNVGAIIRAFEMVAADIPHDLVIAGVRGWLTAEVDALYRASPVRERIHFPGEIAVTDKPAVYAAADVFVYPSFYEGFGFPPLEALVAGTPVITSLSSSLPEIVGEWAELINPYDIGELALVMRQVVCSKRRIAAAVRHEVQARYSWRQAAAKTLACITNVVSDAHRA